MKICFYNVTATYLHGGLETYCWEAGRALSRRGHQVDIVAGDLGDARHAEVNLVRFPFRPEKEWPDLGVRFRRLAERASFARHSVRHMVRADYDAVIVNKPFDFPILWLARRMGLRSTTVFRSGGTDFYPGDRRFAGVIDRWLSASQFNARQIESRYGRPTSVVHNGVDVEVFRPAGKDLVCRSEWARDGDVVLVTVGRLVGWKGVDVAIEAMATLPAEARLVIVGYGPEEGRLRSRASALGVTDRVTFVGRVVHSDLPGLLSQCDVFVQPSVGDEAFGISIVEAMACGLPVVATDNGGIPEIVTAGLTGHLVPRGNVSELSRALRELIVDPKIRQVMGVAARERALSEFTWARNAERLERVIRTGSVDGEATCAESLVR